MANNQQSERLDYSKGRDLKKLAFLLSFCVLPLPVSAQGKSVIDSLKSALEKAKDDTAAINLMTDLAENYYYVDLEKSKYYGNQAAARSVKAGYIKGQWNGYNIQGYLSYRKGRYDSAIYFFKKGFGLSTEKKYDRQRVFSYYWIGSAYMNKAKFDEAVANMKKSLQLAQENNFHDDIANGYKGLGMTYYSRGEYRPALENYLQADSLMQDEVSINHGDLLQNIGLVYHILENKKPEKEFYLRALDIYYKLNDAYGISTIELRLGNFEKDAGNFKQAETHLLNALSFFEKMNDKQKVGEAINYLGRLYLLMKEYDKSLDYFKNAIRLLEETSYIIPLTVAYLGKGEAHIGLGHSGKAVEALNRSRRLSNLSNNLTTRTEMLESLSKLYASNGNFEKAYEAQLEHQQAADSLAKIKNSKVIHEMEAKYQNERKQLEIDKMASESLLKEQTAKTQRNIFFLVLAAVVSLAAVLYFLYRTKQKANAKLRALDEMKSRFFANISHEFRTPLTLIAGPVEKRLTNESLHSGDRREFEMIKRSSDRLLSLVDQLLDLSKIESGNMRLQAAPGDISNLLKSVASSFEYPAEKKRITYTASIPQATGEAWFDADVLQKIAGNLLSNALKYTPEKGIVSFNAGIASGKLEMIFKNSGPGIPREDLDKIFERFYQIDGAESGSGIGLALVKELTALSHGRLKVESDPGQTTAFTVILPLRKEAYGKHELSSVEKPRKVVAGDAIEFELPESAAEEITGEGKPLILIVEDNADVRTFIKSILKMEYRLIEAADGVSGIEKALTEIPDFIISDVMMPETDGIELCRQLKTDERTSHIPVILLTARAGEEHELAGLETGADDYITKPFSSEKLQVRIRKLIELRKRLHERFSQEVALKPREINLNAVEAGFLEKVQRIMDERLTDGEFNAESFSREIGMSRMHLHRKLKGLTGLSANVFIRTHRLKLAAEMLGSSDVNVSEVGYAVGFSDPSYFAKCFKDFYKCTPTEFAGKREYTGPFGGREG